MTALSSVLVFSFGQTATTPAEKLYRFEHFSIAIWPGNEFLGPATQTRCEQCLAKKVKRRREGSSVRIHRNRQRPPSNGSIERAQSTSPKFALL